MVRLCLVSPRIRALASFTWAPLRSHEKRERPPMVIELWLAMLRLDHAR